MTKQETIKEAYGQYYDDCMPDENGWFNVHNAKIKFKNYYLLENFDEEGNYRRPKSLSGIENNNGWIKIESEADLPREDGFYNLCNIDKDGYLPAEPLGILITFYNTKTITHYQPIEKPKPPIY